MIAQPKFRFSLANLLLAIVPLAAMCGSVAYFLGDGFLGDGSAGAVASVIVGIPTAIGALVNGGRGLYVGLAIGSYSLVIVPILLLGIAVIDVIVIQVVHLLTGG